MAANPNALVSVEEYLHTAYDPDCDFVDGVVEGRNAGEGEHSLLQMVLGTHIQNLTRKLGIRAWSEQRIRVSASRYRIPDLCVTKGRGPVPRIIEEAPIVCIEILSREDRMYRIMQRAADYQVMGVSHVWIVDPLERVAFRYQDNSVKVIENGILEAPEIALSINLADVFADIDE